MKYTFSLDPYFGQNTYAAGVEFSLITKANLFTPKDLGVTATNINYWDKQGILASNRKDTADWRRFNFIDFVWLRLVKEWRALGVPVEHIKEAKRTLFDGVDMDYKALHAELKKNEQAIRDFLHVDEQLKDQIFKEIDRNKNYTRRQAAKDGLTYFLFCISTALAERTPVSILLFSEGDCNVWVQSHEKRYDKEYKDRLLNDSYVSVSLSRIIKDFLEDERSTFLLKQSPILQPNEIKLLEVIQSGEYDSITVHFRNKGMESLELRKREDVKRKIVDILKDGDYGEILIKRHKGMVSRIENVAKVYFDKTPVK